MCHYTHLTPFEREKILFFLAEGKDITDTPEDYIQRKYHELNLRPRKCLGYKTPYEVYFSKLLHLA